MNRNIVSRNLTLAALLLSANLRAAGVDNAAAEQKRAAQKMFEAADGLYESGRLDEAVQAFRASYDLVASPNTRLMLARSLRELQHYDEAYKEYQGTIRDAEASGGKYPEALSAARAESEALSSQLEASQTQHISPKPEVAPPPKEVAQPTTVRQPPSVAPHSNGLRTGAYVAGGVGLLGFASFGLFGALDHSAYSDLKSKCAGGCPSNVSHDVDAGRRDQLLANIGLAVGAVGVVTAVTLFLVSGPKHSQEHPVAIRLGPGHVVVDGRF
jgi:hypothetical protein